MSWCTSKQHIESNWLSYHFPVFCYPLAMFLASECALLVDLCLCRTGMGNER